MYSNLMVRRRRNNKSRKSKAKLSRAVKSEMRRIAYSTQETKHHRVTNDSETIYTPIPRDGLGYELNSVNSQGVSSGQFVGQEIRQMGIQVKAILRQLTNSNPGQEWQGIPPGGIIRMMAVQFTQAFQSRIQAQLNASTQPTWSEMFYQDDGDYRLVSPVRESHVERKYLDKTYVLDNLTGLNRDTKVVSHFIKLGMKKYTFDEPGAISSTGGSDKIYLLFFSDVVTAGQQNPDMTFHSTLWYKDA